MLGVVTQSTEALLIACGSCKNAQPKKQKYINQCCTSAADEVDHTYLYLSQHFLLKNDFLDYKKDTLL